MKVTLSPWTRTGALGLGAAVALLASCKAPSSFQIADTDADERISRSEFERYLLESIYQEADTDGDAQITFEEWRVANPDAERGKFKLPDSNRDSVVSPAELRAYFDREDKLDGLFDKIDTGGDGYLDNAEVEAFQAKVEAQAGSTDLQKLSRTASK